MQSERLKRRTPWTAGEKTLLAAIVAASIAGAAIWASFNSLDRMPNIKIPARAEPSPNGYAYFVAAANSAVEGGAALPPLPRSNISTPPAQWLTKPPSAAALAADRRVAPQNAAALALLRQGLSVPCLVPPRLNPRAPRPLSKLRHLARAAHDTAMAMAADGHWTAAMNTATDCLALGEHMTRGGDIIDFLVGNACQSIALRPLWMMVSHVDLKTARLAARRIFAIDSQATQFGAILTAEKWETVGVMMQAFRKPTWRADLLSELALNGKVDPERARALSLVSKQALAGAYVQRMDESVAITTGPFRPRITLHKSGIEYVDEALTIDPTSLWFRWCKAAVDNRMLATTFALRAYQMDHGSYPVTLDALVPAYLPAVPQDQFSTGTLKYMPAGGVYKLYSIGPDGKDDGGKPTFEPNGLPQYYTLISSQGDIVAGLNE